jgi:hypothetical protein
MVRRVLMNRFNTAATFVATLALASFCIACSPEIRSQPPLFAPRIESVSLPYVQSVDFPVTIRAGQPCTVIIHISADADPEMLGWYDNQLRQNLTDSAEPWVISPGDWPAAGYDLVRLWVSRAEQPVTPSTSLEVQLRPQVEGSRILRVQSAADEADGGIVGWFWPGDDGSKLGDIAPGTVYRDYPYTVLPAGGGG